ncbi:hypothetical protein ACPOL_1246 [Acidisarcina polymorpha]|uniref:Uncharacterized protein n=1 Tax=Acidisarcina polymorpha TaxID=2211140 RepID=A0A2Z5FVS0_9BACT|nr:hypothetical protein ACPOL_1246 [Acidisarcina polymorpha]
MAGLNHTAANRFNVEWAAIGVALKTFFLDRTNLDIND